MNIFYLSSRPHIAAKYHCDMHVVKMILETAQLLSIAHREMDGNGYADRVGLYKSTHQNHPSALWARKNRSNYRWLHSLLVALCEEYTTRYSKVHKTQRVGIVDSLLRPPINIKEGYFSAPPQCMPEGYKADNPIDAYRNYYLGEKLRIAKWKYTKVPYWVEQRVDVNKVT